MLPVVRSHAPATSEPSQLRARKKQKTRLAIEDAALDLFAERGYEETTVDQIAGRAEVSKATFFRYFDSKADVIFGVPEERHRELQRGITERPPVEDPLTAVHRAMRENWLPDVDPLRTMRQTRAARTSPILRGLSLDLGVRWQEDVSSALEQRLGAEAADYACRMVAAMAFMVLSAAVNRWMDGGAVGDLGVVMDEEFELLRTMCCGASTEQEGTR